MNSRRVKITNLLWIRLRILNSRVVAASLINGLDTSFLNGVRNLSRLGMIKGHLRKYLKLLLNCLRVSILIKEFKGSILLAG
jgi:hypothetical protein